MWNLLRKIKRFFSPDPVEKFWRLRDILVRPTPIQKAFLPFYTHSMQKILDRNNATIPCIEEVDHFVTPHGLCGIFISYGAKIGTGCTIFHQVTVGANTLPDSRGQGAPTIGDNVYIGAGAKIIGNVTIGNNVRIGANAVVAFDVPDNATVVQESPRVILRDAPRDNTFITWAQYSKQKNASAK